MTPGTRLFGCHQNSSFRAFLVVFVGYNTLFWGPGRFRWPETPGTQLFGRRQNSSFRAFLVVFVEYNTLFWGPGTVFMSLDPRYTAIWTWSKLVILSISGHFCGLITDCFGVRGRFRWPVTPGTRLF